MNHKAGIGLHNLVFVRLEKNHTAAIAFIDIQIDGAFFQIVMKEYIFGYEQGRCGQRSASALRID